LNKYEILQEKLKMLEENPLNVTPNETRKSPLKNHGLPEKIARNLSIFEDNKEFTKPGLSLTELAEKIGTNTSYLSNYINDTKGIPFKNYLNTLRINYITHLLNTDRKYLNYTIESLAKECGISTRQSFTTLFYEINGMRPKDFIRKKLDELQKSQD
jgi:YesN/AraC family two-component response regulator